MIPKMINVMGLETRFLRLCMEADRSSSELGSSKTTSIIVQGVAL